MKKYLAIILATLMIFTLAPGVAMADEAGAEDQTENPAEETLSTEQDEISELSDIVEAGTCGDFALWTLDSNGLLTIKSDEEDTDKAEMEFDFDGYFMSPWEDYKESIKEVVIKDGITNIEENAFSGCSNMTSITIPSSVTKIGEDAFAQCSSLTSVTIPSGVTKIGDYTFYSCSSLTSVAIPSSLTRIGENAFALCSSLTSITIPSSVTSIEYGAFRYCGSLNSITIPSSVKEIGTSAFSGCGNLTEIKVDSDNTVYDSRNNCNAIIESSENILLKGCENTVIPSDVTRIENEAFSECSGLTNITIPSGVKSIGCYAFYHCTNMTNVNIPSGVTGIEQRAFMSCSNLTSLTISESVNEIGTEAFSGCGNLTEIKVDSDNTVYNSKDNCNAIIETKTGKLIKGCNNTVIPSNIKRIDNGAFSQCSNLTSITIPSSVTSIGRSAFSGCSSLTSITIPSSVKTIESWAFYCCTNMKEIIVSPNVTSIQSGAFGYYFEDIDKLIPGVVIKGYTGSEAERYANANKMSFESAGIVEPKSINISASSYSYTGKAIKPEVTVKSNFGNDIPASYYTVKYTNNQKIGTAKITVTFKGAYKGYKALTKTFKIVKGANPIKLKASSKTFKQSALKNKALTYTISLKNKGQGKVTYTLSKAAKKANIKVSSKGTITVPKGCKKGTYEITVKAAGNSCYKAGSVIFKVIVK